MDDTRKAIQEIIKKRKDKEQVKEVELRALDTATTVALVASIVTGAAGVTLLVVDLLPGETDERTADAQLRLGIGSVSLAGSF